MCNLYSITRAQEAARRLFAVSRDVTGNLPPLPDVFPDQLAPIVRVADGERQLEMMRWGMPGPPQFGSAPVTNIRNTKVKASRDPATATRLLERLQLAESSRSVQCMVGAKRTFD